MQQLGFYQIVKAELAAVDQLIQTYLQSHAPLVEQISNHLIRSGGKRLRPLLVLLCGNALGYQSTPLHLLAASIELLHTATLLHDDVVDVSDLRRGKPTANALWGNASSVLVGDFLYSRAFEMMIALDSTPIMRTLSKATRILSEGELLQLSKIRNTDLSENTYLEIIGCKTGVLFEVSCHCSALLANASEEHIKASIAYASALGMAFQLIDDWLDYSGDANLLGKNIGDDLAEGKLTLPLIHLIQNGKPDEVLLVKKAIKTGGTQDLPMLQKIIHESGALNYTLNMANQFIDEALINLARFPQNPYTIAMQELTRFITSRSQ